MPCHRKGCDNIMCRTYVNSVGYVCSDCQSEFEFFVSAKNKKRTKSKLLRWLGEFMEIPISRNRYTSIEDEGITTEEFFRTYNTAY